jgi:HEAT repeat protein
MKRRVAILCAVVLAGALGGLAWHGLGSHGPAYQGKPLSAWMDEWNKYLLANRGSPDRAKRDQALAAIRQIGSEALPALLSMAGAKDSALKKRLIALANKQSLLRLRLHPADYYHARATYGFSALGSAAKPAVPALIRLLHDQDRQVRASAAQCLSLIGPEAADAVPALIQTLNAEGNGYGPVLINSMLALGAIHSEPETVLSLLLEYVNGPRKDWNYSASAMDALGRYRERARAAVPAILPFLTDPDESHRSSADAALCAIDPQAAARAQKK